MSRWWSVDPLADKFASYSPYNYVLNNPFKYMDPDGRDIVLLGSNNSSVTVITPHIDMVLDASYYVGDLGDNYELQGDDVFEAVLDVGGLVDQSGAVDGLAAYYYYQKGSYFDSFISGASVVPAEDALKLARASKHVKTIQKAVETMNNGKTAKKVAKTFCFIAGTPVLTSLLFKDIEDIEIGEDVLAYDIKTDTLELAHLSEHSINATYGDVASISNTELVESGNVLSLKAIDVLSNPQILLNSWEEDAIPIESYSKEEAIIQTQINEQGVDAIVTYSPLDKENEWTQIDHEEITPFTWKWVDLQLTKSDSSISHIHLLRPNWWLRKAGADSIGKKTYLNIEELGLEGWSTVTDIRINQLDTRLWNENRDGDYVYRPITGKFEHESSEVYYLQFGEKDNLLGVTASHPIWSTDRNAWIAAGDLNIGETVKTYDGEVVLKSKEKLEDKQKVYNLEVYKDHNFLVSTDKILVHNTCWGGTFRYRGRGWEKSIDHIWDLHSFANKSSDKSYFASRYSTKGKIKELVSSARARAKEQNNSGYLRDDGVRVIEVKMDEFIGFDASNNSRKTNIITIFIQDGRFKNAFSGKL